jgi:AraC-like DNA-binding protein
MNAEATVAQAIRFIEDNLRTDIGVADAANAVHYSQFYFSRLFSQCARVSVYDYILKRKLTESRKALLKSHGRIIDLALEYGFQSGEGYARAFRKMFGENPSEAARPKPFQMFEPIGEAYLSFLMELKVEIADQPAPPCRFELDPDGGDELMILTDDLLCVKTRLSGHAGMPDDRRLALRLDPLRHAARVHPADFGHAFRFFTNNLYDASRMGMNYILIRRDGDWLNFFIPMRNIKASKAPRDCR